MSTLQISSPLKLAAQQIVGELPENATWDVIEYAVYVARRVQEGRDAVLRKDYVSSEIAKEQLKEWLE